MTGSGFDGGAWISDAWTYRGFPAIVLENGRIRMTVLPTHGAKVVELISKAADRDLLYHHPRFDVRPPVFGANADDWWTGGIDEIPPTGHPAVVGGEQLPFLGEFWSQAWTARIAPFGANVGRRRAELRRDHHPPPDRAPDGAPGRRAVRPVDPSRHQRRLRAGPLHVGHPSRDRRPTRGADPGAGRGGPVTAKVLADTVERFHRMHEELHTYASRDQQPILRGLHLQAVAVEAKPDPEGVAARAREPAARRAEGVLPRPICRDARV